MLSDDDLERYARQAIMPAIGERGQEQLLAARAEEVGEIQRIRLGRRQ